MSDDLALCLRLLKRDHAAEEGWHILYFELRPWVFSMACRRLKGDVWGAADVAQEVFLSIYMYCDFGNLAGVEQLKNYVAGVTRNASTKLALEPIPHERAPKPAVAEQDDRALLRAIMNEVLDLVDTDERKLLLMWCEGGTMSELGEAIGVSSGAAAVRVHRLKRRLAGMLSSTSFTRLEEDVT